MGGHGHASVGASVPQGRLRLVIEDDGERFDTTAPTDRLGPLGIGEHIVPIGGELRIEPVPGAGTTVAVELEVANG